jgi:hypothetical protein
MKLGSKKVQQSQLLDALGGEIDSVEEISAPSTPAPVDTAAQGSTRAPSTLPSDAERCVVISNFTLHEVLNNYFIVFISSYAKPYPRLSHTRAV